MANLNDQRHCDPEIYAHGETLGALPISSHPARKLCHELERVTGWRWDWHYVGGWPVFKFLRTSPGPDSRDAELELCRQELAHWERRDEATAAALADALGAPVVADTSETALVGYVQVLASERDQAKTEHGGILLLIEQLQASRGYALRRPVVGAKAAEITRLRAALKRRHECQRCGGTGILEGWDDRDNPTTTQCDCWAVARDALATTPNWRCCQVPRPVGQQPSIGAETSCVAELIRCQEERASLIAELDHARQVVSAVDDLVAENTRLRAEKRQLLRRWLRCDQMCLSEVEARYPVDAGSDQPDSRDAENARLREALEHIKWAALDAAASGGTDIMRNLFEAQRWADDALATPDASTTVVRPGLFQRGEFRLHSGSQSGFKIECDALVESDWQAIAALVAERVRFGAVVGIANGGIPFAKALQPYITSGPTLIVDDVLTTGGSMERARQDHPRALGVVLFARGQCPDWITPVFQMWPGPGAAVLAGEQSWQPIETAPKDGQAILLLSEEYTDPPAFEGDTPHHHPAKCVIGCWNPSGHSWVDELGLFEGPAYSLAVTGTWSASGGWFQPNEVTHWMPLPLTVAPEPDAVVLTREQADALIQTSRAVAEHCVHPWCLVHCHHYQAWQEARKALEVKQSG